MKKFIEFEIHDYMDLYPRSEYRAMEESQATEFANHMNEVYSGGTTKVHHVMTKEEALQHTLKEIKDVVKKPSVVLSDGSLCKEDVDFIKNLLSVLDECYK